MISSYRRGNVTLNVETRTGLDEVTFTVLHEVTFTILREAPLNEDDVRRLNRELADHPAARGAQLVHLPETGVWVVRADTDLVTDNGDPTAELRWVATEPNATAGVR